MHHGRVKTLGPRILRLHLCSHLRRMLQRRLDLYWLMLQLQRLGLKLLLLQLLWLDVELLWDLRHRDEGERHGHGWATGHS